MENKVMQHVNVEEYPFFFAKDQEKLVKLSYLELQENVLKPYLAQRDEKINKVMAANISSRDKKLIITELKAIAFNYLNDVARIGFIDKAAVTKFIIDVFDASNPTPEIFPAGPQFYGYIDNYVRYLETKAFLKIGEEKIPPSQPIPYFGISLDSANIFVKKYSKAQWRFLGAATNLPLNIVEQYTFQLITNSIVNKELRQAIDLTSAFQKLFPKSEHLIPINEQINGLKSILAENENNAAIKILANFENTQSIYEVIKSLKGKVVYLDVWGTWCGPCKEELKFNPELKAKFKGKDVVFVYLDLDDDNLDHAWREFIKVNQMEGLHLRKSRQTIVPFWKELLANATDKTEYYPQYFIFDKTGKLVVTKAKRPSQKDELYTQIEEFLK
ncbi:MAG: TlpA family protein disulfide reductase [Flavobacterium sp.]|nr:MAG: TlpA family protein disulfide reductase [Flavobacterium sp.]